MPADPPDDEVHVRRVVAEDWPALRDLRLEVHEDNGPARAAYARLGFAGTGVRRPYPLDPGGDELEMVLELVRGHGPGAAAAIGYRRGLLRGAPP